jgi:hypothetical protein
MPIPIQEEPESTVGRRPPGPPPRPEGETGGPTRSGAAIRREEGDESEAGAEIRDRERDEPPVIQGIEE